MHVVATDVKKANYDLVCQIIRRPQERLSSFNHRELRFSFYGGRMLLLSKDKCKRGGLQQFEKYTDTWMCGKVALTH